MTEEPNTTTNANTTHHPAKHWVGWAVTLLAVPVVYVLAFPPVYFGVLTGWGTTNPNLAAVPSWLEQMTAPYDWLLGNTVLRRPLNLYLDWWMKTWLERVPPVP